MAAPSTELELLVPLVNSITVQDVSASDLLHQFLYGVMKLVELLPSMSNAVKEVKEAEKCVQSILVCITADSDPEVRDKFATLQKEFRAFIRVGKDFLENCLSMAKYATDEQHLTEIKVQLKSKILNKLKVYIDSLSGYVKECDESFVKFPTTYEEMNKRVSDAKKHFSDQLQEAKKKHDDAAEKHERAVVERTSGEAFTTVLSMASRGGATAGAMGLVSPDVAVLGSLFTLFQTYLARTNEGTAVLDVMKQERAREEMATKKKILEDAVRRVVDLRESVLNAESLVKDMKSYLDRASKVLQQKRGLTDSNDEQNIDFHDLKNKLDKLKRAAGEIVTAIGEKGSTPITSNINQLNS